MTGIPGCAVRDGRGRGFVGKEGGKSAGGPRFGVSTGGVAGWARTVLKGFSAVPLELRLRYEKPPRGFRGGTGLGDGFAVVTGRTGLAGCSGGLVVAKTGGRSAGRGVGSGQIGGRSGGGPTASVYRGVNEKTGGSDGMGLVGAGL